MKNKILKIVVVAFVIASTLATMVLPALADSASLPQLVSLDLTTPESISNYWTFEGGAEYDEYSGSISNGSVGISVPVSDFPINSGLYCLTYAGNMPYGTCHALIGDYSAALIRNSRGSMLLEPFGAIGRDNISCSFIVSLTEGRAWTYFRGALSEISFDSLTHYSDVSCYFDMHFESVYDGNCILQLSLQELPSSFLYYLKGEDSYSKGVNDGYENGYSEGHSEGEELGYDTGFRVGRAEGYNNGFIDGEASGYLSGYREAEEQGLVYVDLFESSSEKVFVSDGLDLSDNRLTVNCSDSSDCKILFNDLGNLDTGYYVVHVSLSSRTPADFNLVCGFDGFSQTFVRCLDGDIFLSDTTDIVGYFGGAAYTNITLFVDYYERICFYVIERGSDNYYSGEFSLINNSSTDDSDYFVGLVFPSSSEGYYNIRNFCMFECRDVLYPSDLVDHFYNNGFIDGYTDGESEGHFNGYKEGYDVGSGHGFQEGYGIGYDEGKDDGYAEGVEVSFDVGAQFGYEGGFRAGKSEGYDHGYVDGKSDGLTEGEEIGYGEGYGEGYGKGYDVGKVDGKKEYYNELYEKGLENIDGNQGTGVQGFLAGMWNGTQGFVQELLDGITFSGLSLRSIVSTVLAIAMAAFLIRLLKG